VKIASDITIGQPMETKIIINFVKNFKPGKSEPSIFDVSMRESSLCKKL
jgi:hypothetical protein